MEELTRALREGRTVRERRNAAEKLGRLKDAGALPFLVAALSDRHHAVRWTAAEALRCLRSPEAAAPLLACLDDEHPGVRAEAAHALAYVADSRCAVRLVLALRDEHTHVAKYAARALGRLGAAAAEQIEPFLLNRNEPWFARWNAVEALAQCDPKRLQQLLSTLLRDPEVEIRMRTVEYLEGTADEPTVAAALDLLRDSSWSVREKAAKALALVGDRPAVQDTLVAALDDPAAEVIARVLRTAAGLRIERASSKLVPFPPGRFARGQGGCRRTGRCTGIPPGSARSARDASRFLPRAALGGRHRNW